MANDVVVTDAKTLPAATDNQIMVVNNYTGTPTPVGRLQSGVYYSFKNAWVNMWGKFAPEVAKMLLKYVPVTRTITINGTTYDLSANRTWTVSGGLVQSIADTNTVTLDATGGELTADVKYQNSTDINLSEDASGLKANFASNDVSQFTNDADYFVNGGALDNGTTATTQAAGNNSTKVATTEYVDRKASCTIQGFSASFSPARSTTYQMGGLYTAAPGTAATGNRRMYVPQTGTIKAVYLYFFVQSTLGTAETSSIYILVNNITANLISSAVTTNSQISTVIDDALNIAVTKGDYVEIQWGTPIWVTAPTGVYINSLILIE